MTDDERRQRNTEAKRLHRARQRGQAPPFVPLYKDLFQGVTIVSNEPPMTPCMEWNRARNGNGYAIVRWRGKLVLASRLVLARKLGRPIPAHLKACHTCDNPPCIAPDHLFEGTHDENMRDMIAKGRHRNGARRDEDPRSFAERAADNYRRHRA